MQSESEGKIDISRLNSLPEKHEFAAAKYFADMGKDIVFLKPSDIPGFHTPDILMEGVEWEIKSPQGGSRNTIESKFREAVQQSHYIIFDLRKTKLPEEKCISQLEREFYARPYLKRLYIICKSGRLLKYPPKS